MSILGGGAPQERREEGERRRKRETYQRWRERSARLRSVREMWRLAEGRARREALLRGWGEWECSAIEGEQRRCSEEKRLERMVLRGWRALSALPHRMRWMAGVEGKVRGRWGGMMLRVCIASWRVLVGPRRLLRTAQSKARRESREAWRVVGRWRAHAREVCGERLMEAFSLSRGVAKECERGVSAWLAWANEQGERQRQCRWVGFPYLEWKEAEDSLNG